MTSRNEIEININANSKNAEKGILRVGQAATRLGTSLLKLGVPLAGVGALALRTFGGFEKSMVRVGAVSQATTEELAALTAVAREMGRTTIFTATESAEALAFLAQAGQSATEALESLPSVLQLAAAGGLDLANAADIVTNVMAGMELEVNDLARANDVLVTAFTSANTNLLQLGQAFKFVGPVAAAAGLSLEETAAALALMGNAGLQASMAGTGLRNIISKLLNTSKEAARAISDLGVSVLNADGSLRDIVDVVAEFERVGLTAADAMKIFGLRAGPAMLALVSQGSGALAELNATMLESGGIAGDIASAQMDTFAGSMAELKAAVESVALDIGGALAPAIRVLIDEIKPVLTTIGNWVQQHPKLTLALVGSSAALVGLGGTLAAVGIVLPVVATGFGLVAGAITSVGVASLVATGRLAAVVSVAFAATASIRTFNAIAEDTASQLSKEGRKAFDDYKDGAASVSDVFKAELKGTVLEAVDAINVFNDGIGDSTDVMKTAAEEAKNLQQEIDKILKGDDAGAAGGGFGRVETGILQVARAIDPLSDILGSTIPKIRSFNSVVFDMSNPMDRAASAIAIFEDNMKLAALPTTNEFTDAILAAGEGGDRLRFRINQLTGETELFTTNMLLARNALEDTKAAMDALAGVVNPLAGFESNLAPPGAGREFGRGGVPTGTTLVSGDLVAQLAALIKAGVLEAGEVALTDEGQFGAGLSLTPQQSAAINVYLDAEQINSRLGQSAEDGA